MIQLYEQEDESILQHLVYRRAERGLLARFLNKTMPPDPKPAFVWPQLAAKASERHFRVRNLALVSLVFLAATIGMVYLLLQVPFLDQSVVKLMTRGFATFIPINWARGIAWTVGLVGVMSIGGFTNHDHIQRGLQSEPATRSKIYNFVLMAALAEEQAFRSGSERWSWPQRVRASVIFGAIHITNIWYSLAAGIALGLTGFGFLLVYQWYYRRTRNQIIATAASATVHALYNMIAFALLLIALCATIVGAFVH